MFIAPPAAAKLPMYYHLKYSPEFTRFQAVAVIRVNYIVASASIGVSSVQSVISAEAVEMPVFLTVMLNVWFFPAARAAKESSALYVCELRVTSN